MSDIVESVLDATELIETQVALVEDGLTFRGKPLSLWQEDIYLPIPHNKMSVTEIQDFNYKFIEINEIIMTNLSYSKSYNEMSKAEYDLAVNRSLESITNSIRNDDKKRLPGFDALNRMAAASCMKQYTAMKVTEMFLEFWRVQYDRMRLIDSRLSNINYLSGRHNV